MKQLRQLLRLLNINRILMKYGLDEIILATHLFRPVRYFLYLLPWNWFRTNREPRAVRLRRVLEELGPIFVKFGQILSTRRDLLPDDLAEEFAKLLDDVPPFSGLLARQIIEKSYGQTIDEVFDDFEERPFASASIAQVHSARLKDGQDVIVKVVRPAIKKVIKRDVSLMYSMATLAERYWPVGKRLRLREVVNEFEKTLIDELDMNREAANAAQLRRNFQGTDMLYVPEVYWPYVRRNVMVMERISGTPICDIDQLRAQSIDLKTLSETGVEIFFTQVFKHNFFHADMHPGNIFVSPEGQYIAVDFGIMGALSHDDQRYLAENFNAFFHRDYRRVAELHMLSGWVPATTRVDEFESAIRSVCEPIFERPLKEISFGRLLLNLFQTAQRFDMKLQPQLVLLQKTLLNIEGLGRQLYPDLDLWNTAKPFMEHWMKENLGGQAFIKNLKDNFPGILENTPKIPTLVYDVLQQAHEGRLTLNWQSKALDEMQVNMKRSHRRIYYSIIGASLLICAVIVGVLETQPQYLLWGESLFAWGLGGVGVALMLFVRPGIND